MTTTALTTRNGGRDLAQLTLEQIDVLKGTICRGATDTELRLFLAIAERTGLDPFLHQIHAVKIWNRDTRREELVPIVGIDGLRLQAQRSGKYRGRVGPYWCGSDGKWVDIWLHKEPPAAARVGVRHADFTEPLWNVARWTDFARRKKDGKLMAMWAQMDAHMLAKCSEAGALRAAFPQETSGLYLREEMWQAEQEAPAQTTEKVPAPLPLSGSVDVSVPVEAPAVEDSARVVEAVSPPEPEPATQKSSPEPKAEAPPGQAPAVQEAVALWAERIEAATSLDSLMDIWAELGPWAAQEGAGARKQVQAVLRAFWTRVEMAAEVALGDAQTVEHVNAVAEHPLVAQAPKPTARKIAALAARAKQLAERVTA